MSACAIEVRTSDFRRRTSVGLRGRCMRRPRVARVARSLKSEVGGLENVQGQSPRRLFLAQSRRGAEDAEVRLKKRTGKVPAGYMSRDGERVVKAIPRITDDPVEAGYEPDKVSGEGLLVEPEIVIFK